LLGIEYMVFRGNAFAKHSSGTLGGGDLYSVHMKLSQSEIQKSRERIRMPEGKRPLGRQRRRRVGNIKMDLREIGWDGMDWIDLAKNRNQWRALVNTLMNIRVP
jgi:hypothetical protein